MSANTGPRIAGQIARRGTVYGFDYDGADAVNDCCTFWISNKVQDGSS